MNWVLQDERLTSLWRLVWTFLTVLITVIWLAFFFPDTYKSAPPAAEDVINAAIPAVKSDVAKKPAEQLFDATTVRR